MSKKLVVVVAWCWARILLGAAVSGYALWHMSVLVGEPLMEMTGKTQLVWAVVVALVAQWAILKFAIWGMKKKSETKDVELTALRRMVRQIAKKRGKKAPEVLLSENGSVSKSPAMLDQAFGRDYVLVGPDCDYGLDKDEIAALMAHELRHDDALANRVKEVLLCWRICIFILCLELVGIWCIRKVTGMPTISFGQLGLIIVVWKCWSIVSRIASAFISRANETMTDCLAALDIGTPEPLKSALEKLSRQQTTQSPAIVRVLLGTHPSIQVRVKILSWLFT